MVSAADIQPKVQSPKSKVKPWALEKAEVDYRIFGFGPWTLDSRLGFMALVRILVDGYSLLHNWPELAPDRPRHSEQARDALVGMLTKYHDATGDPITVFFDGAGAPPHVPKNESRQGIEVLFSGPGQTADDMIERVAHRFQDYGEVMVVTDDFAERAVVGGFGGLVASCANFIRMMGDALGNLSEDLENYNRTEQKRFKRPT
jgi:predicted RNA-binding protein with PIN domain